MPHNPISDARAAASRGDYESAIRGLRPAAEDGNREAQYELGFLALTECDLISGREAFSLFMKAAEQGHAEAMYHLAKFPEFLGEPFKLPLSDEGAWNWLVRAAESGCLLAQYDAGASLATGNWGDTGVRKDLEAADAAIFAGKPSISALSAESKPSSRIANPIEALLQRLQVGKQSLGVNRIHQLPPTSANASPPRGLVRSLLPATA